jgi:hypothetical protein
MSLSALIKKGGLRKAATATLATSATDEAPTPPSVATVATVAVATAPDKAANDPAHVQAFDPEAFAERAAIMEHDGGMSRAEAEAAAAVICGDAPAPEALDSDRHCWPHTEAWNTAEIDTFTARLHLFTRHGLDCAQAEGLADGLVVRDRQTDDRRLCLECSHMRRTGGLWRCGQWQPAGLAAAEVPGEVVKLLQRCEGFKEGMR